MKSKNNDLLGEIANQRLEFDMAFYTESFTKQIERESIESEPGSN